MQAFFEHQTGAYFYEHLQSPADMSIPFAKQPFACLLWNATPGTSPEERLKFSQVLLDLGCTYLVAAGVDCEQWHDAADSAFIALDLAEPEYSRRFLMTTWHSNEPVEEVAFFLVYCALPQSESGVEEYQSRIVVQYGGDSGLGEQLRAAVIQEATKPPDPDDDEPEAA